VIDVLNLLIVHPYILVSGPSSQMMRRALSLNVLTVLAVLACPRQCVLTRVACVLGGMVPVCRGA